MKLWQVSCDFFTMLCFNMSWPLWLPCCRFFELFWIPCNTLWDAHNALSGNSQCVVSLFLATRCRNPVFWLVNTAAGCDILATHCDFFRMCCHNKLWLAPYGLWIVIHGNGMQITARMLQFTELCTKSPYATMRCTRGIHGMWLWQLVAKLVPLT